MLLARTVERDNSSEIVKEAFIRFPLRLGEDTFTTGRIGPKTQKRLIAVLRGFRALAAAYGAKYLRACATSALREARNGSAVTRAVRRHAGVALEILNGREEARLILAGFAPQLGNRGFLYVDIGGGSTEISLVQRGRAVASRSFRLGAVRLLHREPPARVWEGVENFLAKLRRRYGSFHGVGSGGSIGKVRDLLGLGTDEPFQLADARKLLKRLAQLSPEERMSRYDLKPDRADGIVPAGRILLFVMKEAGLKEMLAPPLSLADGLAREIFYRARRRRN